VTLRKSSSQRVPIGVGGAGRRVDAVEVDTTDLHLIGVVIDVVAFIGTAIGIREVAGLIQVIVGLGGDHCMR